MRITEMKLPWKKNEKRIERKRKRRRRKENISFRGIEVDDCVWWPLVIMMDGSGNVMSGEEGRGETMKIQPKSMLLGNKWKFMPFGSNKHVCAHCPKFRSLPQWCSLSLQILLGRSLRFPNIIPSNVLNGILSSITRYPWRLWPIRTITKMGGIRTITAFDELRFQTEIFSSKIKFAHLIKIYKW